jgi:hypothetical protein
VGNDSEGDDNDHFHTVLNHGPYNLVLLIFWILVIINKSNIVRIIKSKEGEKNGACSTQGRVGKCIQEFVRKASKEMTTYKTYA